MRIAVPREIKNREYRVALTPAGVRELAAGGHEVVVEAGAGEGAGFPDREYEAAGARIEPDVEALFAGAGLIVKVKEPQPVECRRLKPGQTLFTYLHLAADRALAEALMASGCTAIAYETITAPDGSLPLLAPMSEIAGRMAVPVAAWCLMKAQSGAGLLLGGVPGVPPARVVVLGGGVAGSQAARMALGAGADVTVVDRSLPRLRQLASEFGNGLKTEYSTRDTIERLVQQADVVIGSVLIPGAAAPRLVTRGMVAGMRPGSVLVDIAIDQGGCFETSRPTSHDDPVFIEHGVVHYCVTNMPGAVPRTSTAALTHATLPYIRALADAGVARALSSDPHFRRGLNVADGEIRSEPVARALGLPLRP
ncbi:MAG: alanine dehydrogenase [Pseudomonadota bacterium]|jgi:alanine dehydrogenase|nr:MAG: alanine dehydrogenase [Pseudomonadota bacterium]